jgi:PEP-CTERM motif
MRHSSRFERELQPRRRGKTCLDHRNEIASVSQTLVFDTPGGAVPEASTWAMMLAGFGGLGFAAFRRARKQPASAIA